MLTTPMTRRLIAAAIAAPIFLTAGAGAQTPNKVPPESKTMLMPKAEFMPGVELSNAAHVTLGTIQRVVEHNGEKFALVTIGGPMSKISNGLIAVPVSGVHLDGQRLVYNISSGRYQRLPVYDGTAPTWMKKKRQQQKAKR